MELSRSYQPHASAFCCSRRPLLRPSFRAPLFWPCSSDHRGNNRLLKAGLSITFSSQTSIKPRWVLKSIIPHASSDSVTTIEEHDTEQPIECNNANSERVGGIVVKARRRPWQQNDLSEDANELGDYLNELKSFKKRLKSMIGDGDQETPAVLVQANYKALREQLIEGNKGLEQAAMLDTLIEACLMLQNMEHVEEMLKQMKDILFNLKVHEPFLDAFLEHTGNVYLAFGNKQEALSCYNRSVSIQETFLGENSPELVGTLLALALAYTEPNERENAKAIYNRVVHILENSKGVTSAELGTPLLHLGYISLAENKSEEAELFMRRALHIAQETTGTGGSIGVATCGLARVKYVKGDYSKAAELYQSGLDTLKKSGLWSSGDLALESIRMEAAEFFSVVGRTQEAQDLWEEVLHEKERAVGVNSPRLVVPLQNLATSYAQVGRFDKCEPLLRRSLKLISSSLGPTAPQVSIPLEFLATTLHHLDRNKEAESLARQALSIREKNFPDDHLLIGEACNVLAAILHENSKNEEALKLAQRALHIKEMHLGKDSKELGMLLDLLLEIMDILGKTAEAGPLIHRLERLVGESGSVAP